MTQTTQKEKTLLSPRIPRDTEHERYHPELEEELPPDRVSLKNVMYDTVDAVLAENDDGILEEPLTLRERLRELTARLHARNSTSMSGRPFWPATGTYWARPGSWGCIQYWKSISRWGKASSLYSLQNTAHRRCDKNLDRIPEPCYPISR